jgi:hypothetical protein
MNHNSEAGALRLQRVLVCCNILFCVNPYPLGKALVALNGILDPD